MSIGIELFNLKGKRALITGSSQGIGYALAKGLDQAGAEIILNGRNKEKLEKSAKSLNAKQSLYKLCFDVTNKNETNEAINKFENETGSIDILINALNEISNNYVKIDELIIGGENSDWSIEEHEDLVFKN